MRPKKSRVLCSLQFTRDRRPVLANPSQTPSGVRSRASTVESYSFEARLTFERSGVCCGYAAVATIPPTRCIAAPALAHCTVYTESLIESLTY